jgi:hypothetical protein
MALKYHPTPLSGGDRKALAKEHGKARAMANILASQSAEMRAKGEVVQPWLRFHIPLIEPDGRISRIRLSDKTSRLHPRHVVTKRS